MASSPSLSGRCAHNAVLGVNGLTDIRNAGGADISGLETDLSWAPVDGLTLIGSATFLNTETTQDICDSDPGTGLSDCVNRLRSPAGTELPVTPDFKANLTARYEFTLGEWEAFVQGSLVHQSDSGVDLRAVEASIVGRLPSYTTFDLSSGFAFGAYTLDFYLDNVFDERAIITGYTECVIAIVPALPGAPVPICGLQPYDAPNQPRTFGVRFGQRF